ncbi:FAD synthase [Methanocalculus chunghsingensis]|uniref:FAD synthase n=1 Tax=Methanocalculus chunghsingensis TaxID=156457 RepID=A0A8J7W5A4_9EURY|nr:adenylyltransferase/cytidyltransferase family protein [Methanocalculus chunghsingensis]MBR1368564.1 FAD synthase [Methanocalculus chunghsingensis]
MTRVVATGTFDIIHPGHLFYLAESKALGDELWVIVARDENVRHKPKPIIPEDQRLRMVLGLKPVDHAVLGDKTDKFQPIRDIAPDIITIGCNQRFAPESLEAELRSHGFEIPVVRIDEYRGCELCSSSKIIERALMQRGHPPSR